MRRIDEILAAADQNLVAAWQGVLRAAPNPGEVADGPVTMLSSGLPVPLFNPAFVVGPVDDPVAVVRRIVDHYASLGAPYVIYGRDEVSPGLAEAGLAAGLVEHWQPPLMVMDPMVASPPAPTGLDIVAVGPDQVDDCCVVLAGGFGMPVEIGRLLFGDTLLALDAYDAFVGYLDGVPVSTAATFVNSGLAGVYSVATVPDARGKGLGAALTWAAVEHGRRQGCTTSILQASSDGQPVYTRMGYATPTRYRQLQGPPAG